MNENPLISVITPTFNSAPYIQSTIQSVKNQTYTNWEMVVVDDCSEDNTREILEQEAAADPRIKLHWLKENSGAAVARNTALREARADFIAFLDADDQWLPEKLAKQLKYMQDNDLAFTYTQYSIMDQNGQDTGKVVEIPQSIDYHGLLKNTIIGFLTVMVNREKTGEIQMPNIRTRQDFALELAILKRGITAYGLQETLSRYRVVKGSISSNKIKTAKRNWQVYRKIEKLGLAYSMWCFVNYAYHAVKKRI